MPQRKTHQPAKYGNGPTKPDILFRFCITLCAIHAILVLAGRRWCILGAHCYRRRIHSNVTLVVKDGIPPIYEAPVQKHGRLPQQQTTMRQNKFMKHMIYLYKQ